MSYIYLDIISNFIIITRKNIIPEEIYAFSDSSSKLINILLNDFIFYVV